MLEEFAIHLPAHFLLVMEQPLFQLLADPPQHGGAGYAAWETEVKHLWRQMYQGTVGADAELHDAAVDRAVRCIAMHGGLDLPVPRARLLKDVLAVKANGLLRILIFQLLWW